MNLDQMMNEILLPGVAATCKRCKRFPRVLDKRGLCPSCVKAASRKLDRPVGQYAGWAK